MTRHNKPRRSKSSSNLHPGMFETISKLSQQLEKQDTQLKQMKRMGFGLLSAGAVTVAAACTLCVAVATHLIEPNRAVISGFYMGIGITAVVGAVVGITAILGIIGFCAYQAYQHRAEIEQAVGKAVEKVKDGVEYTKDKLSKLLPHSAKNQSQPVAESTQHDDGASVKSSTSELENQSYVEIKPQSSHVEITVAEAAEHEKKGNDSRRSLGSDRIQDTISVSSLDNGRSPRIQRTPSTSTIDSYYHDAIGNDAQESRDISAHQLTPSLALQHPKVEPTEPSSQVDSINFRWECDSHSYFFALYLLQNSYNKYHKTALY
ncbi:hypothetical protein BIY23_04395 [Wolbachia pipientis]|uniref:Uncharacterized protein n=1 Tax=Wolbachia pipientis TaxID=955 RepID=A0A1E7QIR4_WOLPI|nr:hypothetical protein [Wolbachia pipientis]OEY86363.1 hypothetical protein BIY23_04395 [Wolbachia pipientis]